MIELSGLTVRDAANPDGDIEVVEIGLRPGEKLYEELLIEENARPTTHPRIVKAHEARIDWSLLQPRLNDLAKAIEGNDVERATALLRLLVAGSRTGDAAVTLTDTDRNDGRLAVN
jgi:FlaA1/EpsC-like NDP-sugar epimerase